MTKKTITEEDARKRFDVIASEILPDLSRSYVTTLIKAGSIVVNDSTEKPGYKLKENDEITVKIDLETAFSIPDIDLPILYEDGNVMVINKPDGVISHSRGRYWYEPSVASFMRQHTGLEGDRTGIVHRLDRATSGVMICSKNQETQSFLQKQFAARTVEKQYTAIAEGHMKQQSAVIDMPIERNPKKPSTFRAGPNGKPSQTYYEVTQSSKTHDLLLLKPKTGRTHQLRVHLLQLGHPIVGDVLYGTEGERLFLHAQSLKIQLPDQDNPSLFESPLPDAFAQFLKEDA